MNIVFGIHGEEDKIYPITTIEIVKAQQKDQKIKVYCKQNAKAPKEDMHFQLIEDTKVLCKNDKLIIPASLWHRTVSWYYYSLQQPGQSCLIKTMRSVMTWKGMSNTIWSYIKSCRSC